MNGCLFALGQALAVTLVAVGICAPAVLVWRLLFDVWLIDSTALAFVGLTILAVWLYLWWDQARSET